MVTLLIDNVPSTFTGWSINWGNKVLTWARSVSVKGR